MAGTERRRQSRPSASGRGRLAWSLLALAAGLAVSAGLALWQHRVDQWLQHDQHRRLAERALNAIEVEVHSAMLLLRAVQSVFLASEEVTAAEFQRVYENLDPREVVPGLQAMAYSRFLGEDAESGPRFQVEKVAPVPGNEALYGLDLATQADNLLTVWRSRDSDRPVLSAGFPLLQYGGRGDPVIGAVIRLPVFSPGPRPRTLRERRQRFVGSLAASFRVDRLIEHAIDDEVRTGFDLQVMDVTGAEPVALYDSHPHGSRHVDPDAHGIEAALELGGRRWLVGLQPLASKTAPSAAVWASLALGALASVLLALWLASVLGGRERALRLAAQMASQRRESESKFSALNELLPALVLVVEAGAGRVCQANRAARERLHLDPADLEVGRGPALAGLLPDRGLVERLLALDSAEDRELSEQGTTLRLPYGEMWVSLSAAAVTLSGESCRLLVLNDIGPLRELNERLAYQASHDALTGLINRYTFEERFDGFLAEVNVGGRLGALLYIDLDQFKVINDTCGHYAGDQLLGELATRLQGSLKTGDVLARLGGDEFGALLVDVDTEQALTVADRVRSAIDGFVFAWEQRSFAVSASIGVVMIDRPGMTRRELLAQADTACYLAKERGRNRSHLFQDSDQATVQRKSEMEWAARLRQALVEGRFVLDYQELYRLKPPRGEEGAHFELLVRLVDEDGKEVAPGAFIPAAERFGLMPLIDRWVVETALAQFGRLHPGGTEVATCAINLSGATVDDERFAEHVLDLLERHRIPPHKLCFEITETVAVSNVARVVRFLQRLRARGCRFALDDFGSGMASFGYLKNLPVDLLKIDGGFIRELESDSANYSIVRAVTDIGHQMGLVVVAEWVGSQRAAELLRGIGVDYGQGFALHRPQRVPLFRD